MKCPAQCLAYGRFSNNTSSYGQPLPYYYYQSTDGFALISPKIPFIYTLPLGICCFLQPLQLLSEILQPAALSYFGPHLKSAALFLNSHPAPHLPPASTAAPELCLHPVTSRVVFAVLHSVCRVRVRVLLPGQQDFCLVNTFSVINGSLCTFNTNDLSLLFDALEGVNHVSKVQFGITKRVRLVFRAAYLTPDVWFDLSEPPFFSSMKLVL